MKTYIITSKSFSGQIECAYNPQGYLARYLNEAEMSEAQLKWFALHIPVCVGDLNKLSGIPNLAIVEYERDPTFDDFYSEYGYKHKKEPARTAWNRLSKADRKAAFQGIGKYRSHLKQNAWKSPMLPASYLNSKTWLD
jgi:hypothetical protein